MPNALEFARLMESSYRSKQREKEGIMTICPEKCTGRQLYTNYKAYFNKYTDEVCKVIENCGMSMEEYFNGVGALAYDRGYNLITSRSEIRSMLGTKEGIRFSIIQIRKLRALDKKYEKVMKSILSTIGYLSKMTIIKGTFFKPSDLLQFIFVNKSLSRYLDQGISFHFLALVPKIDQIMDKIAERYVDPLNPKGEKVMDPLYKKFIDNLPVLKQEAMAACRKYQFSFANLLSTMDTYYFNNKADLVKKVESEKK